jgi:lipopolysaccharide export system protein LptC
MRRRILLVLTTLAALLGAFYVYTLLAGREGLNNPREGNIPALAIPATSPAGGGQGPVRDAQDVEIISRDEHNNLQGVYRAERWDRRGDGAQVLTKPRVELYLKDGEQVILRADKAELYGQELNRGVNIRRAKLTGKVTIFLDRSRLPDRLPVEQRPDEVVRVFVEEVDVDLEHMTITTDKQVTVFSPEADIYGRGMTISWNESPRELQLLRIEHGEYMAVYNVPPELDMIALPSSEPTTSPAAPASAPSTGPAKMPATLQSSQPAQAQSRPAGSQPAGSRPAADPNKPLPRNQYQAEFHDDVKVIHRNRRLSGANVLTLKFDWDDAWRKDPNNVLGPSRRVRRGEAASGPATAPSAAAQPAGAPASAPASSQPGQGAEPMEIYWTGPLVIVPTGRTETPSRGTYDLSAEGNRLVLTDARATVLCRRFSYQHPRRSGWLEGGPGQPVRMLLSEGADVACDRIRFEPGNGKAWLYGAGHMARRFPDGLSQAQAIEFIETDEPELLPASERITWARSVELAFTNEKATRKGETTTRQFIRQADFHQGVLLRQSADPNGDVVECDDLSVAMGHSVRGSSYPKTAVAVGHVKARQEGSNVSAGKITVDFVEDDAPRAARPAGARTADLSLASGARVRPATIVAEGGVVINDRRDPNAEPLTATADRMVSKLIENDRARRTAVLTGTPDAPARIEQGPNRLIGREIRLDQTDDSAAVDGAGWLEFITKKDADGNDLPEPRFVKVQWAKAMGFSGKKRTAEFSGDVAMDSALDDVRCQELQLVFTEQLGEPNSPAPAADGARPAVGAVAPAAKKPAGRDRASRLGGMALGMEQYSRRRISMIYAEKDIVLRSRREDEQNRLVRRMQLAGEKLIYDAEGQRITMLGRGTLMAEDYDKPRPRKVADSEGMIAAVDRPSQSAFAWNKSMVLSQKDRVVTLEGGVILDHRSGDQILGKDKLNVPRDQWGTLPAGRKTRLECDTMMARFGEPVSKPATQPSTRPSRRSAGDPLREGPTMGPLDLFSATGDVSLRALEKDGQRHVLAQRLIYNREKDLAVVWGYLEGRPVAKGSITSEDPQTGRSQTFASPKFIWYRLDNRIFAEDVSASGGR